MDRMAHTLLYYLTGCLLAAVGGLAAASLAAAKSGRMHLAVGVAGGLATGLLFGVSAHFATLSLVLRCLIGALLGTASEYLAGALVNVGLRRAVWDCSDKPPQLYGQICLRHSVLFLLASAPACLLMDVVYTLFLS